MLWSDQPRTRPYSKSNSLSVSDKNVESFLERKMTPEDPFDKVYDNLPEDVRKKQDRQALLFFFFILLSGFTLGVLVKHFLGA